MNNEKWIVFPKSQYVNSNPATTTIHMATKLGSGEIP